MLLSRLDRVLNSFWSKTRRGGGRFPAPRRGGARDVTRSRCRVTWLRWRLPGFSSVKRRSLRDSQRETCGVTLGGCGSLEGLVPCSTGMASVLCLVTARPAGRPGDLFRLRRLDRGWVFWLCCRNSGQLGRVLGVPFPRQTSHPSFKRRRLPWGSGARSWSAWAGPEGRGGSPHAFRKKPHVGLSPHSRACFLGSELERRALHGSAAQKWLPRPSG